MEQQLQQVKFIPKEIADVVKDTIPVENVLVKLFNNMQYKKDRSTAKIKVFKNNGYIGFVFTNSNTATVKSNINGQTIATGDSINLVQKTLNKNFKDAVLWLLKEFNLIKSVENGEIILNNKQIEAIKLEYEQEKEKNLHELELKEEIARQQIQYFKQIGTLQIDKDVRGISKDLINLIAKDNNAFKIVKNADKGNRIEFKIALKDFNNNIDGLQTIYFNVFSKKWDKRNVGRANISYFGNKNAENVVITESFFDSLSAVEVMAKMGNVSYKDLLSDYLFISINGQYSSLKNNTLKQFLAQAQQVILAHDRDNTGENYDKMYLINGTFWEDVKGKEVYILKPRNFKDLNDFVKSDEFKKDDDIKKYLTMGIADVVYLDYLNSKRFEKQLEELEQEEQREVTVSGEKEGQQQEKEEQQQEQSFLPEQVSKTFNLSEILGELKQTKTVKDTTNYFYTVEDDKIKFTRFTPKQAGIKATGVFFKQGAYVEIDGDKEKGTGVVILQGRNVNKIEDTENVIFANNIISAFKLAKAKGVDISRSFIFVVKNQSLENKILFDNFTYYLRPKNVFAVLNKNKSGKFLAELISENPNTKVMEVTAVMEDKLKGVEVVNDVVTVSTASGKEKDKQLALEF